MARADAPIPTLALVLRHISTVLAVEIEDVIAGRDENASEARELFCWLGAHLTGAAPEAISFAIGADPEEVEHRRDAVDLRRKSDRPFRDRLSEVALEIRVEAGLIKRSLLAGATDRDAATTARRILSGRRNAMAVPPIDLVHLAASYEALVDVVVGLDRAERAWEAVRYTPAERHARQQRDRAAANLLRSIPQSRKEPAHG